MAARPDLIRPVPEDLAALALRAGSPPSVAAALRDLDELALHVLLAAALGPDPTTPAALARAVAATSPTARSSPGTPSSPGRSSETGEILPSAPEHPTPSGGSAGAEAAGAAGGPVSPVTGPARDQIRQVVARLRGHALLWGTERALHVVGAARDQLVPAQLGPRLAGLDPVVAGYAREPRSLLELMASAPEAAVAALDRLLAGPLVGTVTDARRVPDSGRGGIDWMLAHHLVVPFGVDRVVVPAEVAAILRANASGAGVPGPLPVPSLVRPDPAAASADPLRVEAGAVGAVLDILHAVAELGAVWADDPPVRVRAGGLALRDLTRTARALGMTEPAAALVIEVAAEAGLVAADGQETPTFLPTPRYDAWLAAAPAVRHADLLAAWRDLPRAVAMPPDRPLDTTRVTGWLPALRRDVLATLADPAGAWTEAEVVAAIRWRAPRRADPARLSAISAVLAEASTLGVLVGGVLTEAGRALLADDRAGIEAALAAALPPQVDALVMQADLTAIVPGLPTPALAALLRLAAHPESTGAASVYRFSEASIRTALDGGRTAAELLAELGRRGAVPQPLAYLVEDAARRHAALRIGSGATFLRCDDPVLLTALLADPAAAELGLFRLSDSVLGSDAPPEEVLGRLRRLGHSPQPEPGRGVRAPGPRRARGRSRTGGAAPTATGAAITAAMAAAAVRVLRAADRKSSPEADLHRRRASAGVGARQPGSGASPGASEGAKGPAGTGRVRAVPDGAPSEIVATLRAAIATGAAVRIGYVDSSGVATDLPVEPLRIAGGYVTALDLRTEAIQSFALARITGVETA